MKRALPFSEQVDISSDESSSSDGDDQITESEQMSNDITSDQVVEELVSEGTKTICDHLDMVNCESEPMSNDIYTGQGVQELVSEVSLTRIAKVYQEYMELVPIPPETPSVIPFHSWTDLAKSMKNLYKQPLHYLTNLRMKQWDQMRVGADNEDNPVGDIIHPTRAEEGIWIMEEVHRRTTSPHYLAELWLADPMYHALIDPIFPKLKSSK